MIGSGRNLSIAFAALVLALSQCAFAQAVPGTDRDGQQIMVRTEGPNGGSPAIASQELPDSPGAVVTESKDFALAQAESPANPPAQQMPASAQEQSPQRPVGTAAAEAPKVTGITAAQPAGIAIAPAKQRRVRTIVLKVGAIVAAGAALGAVIALSEATPSKPPGAH